MREYKKRMILSVKINLFLKERRIMHERSDKKDDSVKPMSLCGVGRLPYCANLSKYFTILRSSL